MSELEDRHYLMNGGETLPTPARRSSGRPRRGLDGRPQVLRPARDLAAHDAAAAGLRRGCVRGRARLRRLVDPRLAGDLGVGHAALPDPSSAILDPGTEAATLSLICEIADPITREGYSRDPRRVARRAEEYLRRPRSRTRASSAPSASSSSSTRSATSSARTRPTTPSTRARATGTPVRPGLGYTSRPKEGYFPTAPHDSLHDLRTAMVLTLERLGIPCEFHHHEVASGGQCEIDLRFQSLTRWRIRS